MASAGREFGCDGDNWLSILGACASAVGGVDEPSGFAGEQSSHPVGSADFPALIYRLPVAVLLVAWGAHFDRRWVLPIGMVLASPVLWLGTFTMLAALPRLQHRSMPPAPADVSPVKNATNQ